MNNKKRGKYLVSLRNRKNLTQSDLAELLHYTDKNISKWENGKSFPTDPNVLNEIAKIFDVPIVNIIYGDDSAVDKINNFSFKKHIFKKFLFYFFIITILLFLTNFLIHFYNNSYVAKVHNNNINNASIKIMINKNYNKLTFNKLKSKNKKIKLVSFYYVDSENNYLLFETENENITITEYSYYLEYNLKSIINKTCYLKVLYNDNSYDVFKLKFRSKL